ncbi:hypothetical protein [Flavobacterium sp. 5]|uniref:hypothetical protein n=1 Tax=Flavobacterium sp. 5 TaxID=2035199 RepID=UPI000C2BE81C|nr:hypothetical protein [Flavobacterium sp. 5]PKB18102.1 hypothetical protein CLU82_3360 [Flavobacterium sp. 5]
MKYLFGIILLLCISCGNKEEVLLPKADRTIVKEVVDLSPIYIFFRVKGKDTLAEVNRKNSIITTNWILNIDKRLPLRLVIPEVMKLQQRKREEKEHKNENALNYYSYADSIGKNLAFLPFTKVYYKLEKPKKGLNLLFDKHGKIFLDGVLIESNQIQKYINNTNETSLDVSYCFDKNMSFDNYIKAKIILESIELKFVTPNEFIY